MGFSNLAKNYNNLFGIKALRDWNGKVANVDTKEWTKNGIITVQQPFRVYNSWNESILDHARFLQKEWYIKAGVFTAKTPKEQIEAIFKGGYCTDSKYIDKILELINKYNLEQYDYTTNTTENSQHEIKKANEEMYGTVTATVLNVRSQPSTNSDIIGKLKNGQQVHIYKDCGNGWLSIYFGEHGGYVSKKYIR